MPRKPKTTAPEQAFGQHLRQLRERKGLSQNRLAAEAGVAPETVRRLEAGLHSPHLALLRKLAQGLGIKTRQVIPQDAT